jgi:hypothetical protein
MSASDPIQLLSRISPVTDEEAAEVFGATGREQLLEAITRLQGDREQPARRRTRRPLVVVVALAVAVAAGTVAWASTRGAARETTSIECEIAGTDTIIDATSGSPAADCAAEWQRELGRPAPRLVAYANTDGGVTVLPKGETAPAGWRRIRSQDVSVIELQESLDDYVNGLNSGCLDASAATTFARQQLDHLGFAGWTIGIRPVSNASGSASPQATNAAGDAQPAPTVSSAGPVCTASDIVDPTTSTVTLIQTHVVKPSSNWIPGRLATSLRPLTTRCLSLPAMRTAVEQRASRLGLSPSPPLTATSYNLSATDDSTLRCATVDETVGGTINLIIRGRAR